MKRTWLASALALMLVGSPVRAGYAAVSAQARSAGPALSGCPARVAVLGADITPGGRFAVQQALRVGPHTLQLDETMAQERAQAHGLVPATLLGASAVSSAVLRPLPPGAGLTVVVNGGITLDTAQTYANVLLTVGLTGADVRAAAPAAQPALGTTALLGLLRAAPAACVPVDPARRDLAIREVVLTDEMAATIGHQAAPSLLFAVMVAAASQPLAAPAPAALARLVTHTAAARGLALPAAQSAALAALLHDLIAHGALAHLAALHLQATSASPGQVTVRTVQPRPPAGAAQLRPGAAARSRAGVWRGIVTSIAAGLVAARLRGGVRVFRPAPALLVYADGARAGLAALRPGEPVTITTSAAGLATMVQAAGSARALSAPANRLHATDAAVVALLTALLLLALVFGPVLVALSRRRAWPGGKQMATAPSAAPRAGARAYAPRGAGRAPLRRKRPS